MTLRVFLSYSLHPAEQALVWRLQTLAAAHGIEMYVPPRGTAGGGSPSGAVKAAIDRSDCVLAIINAKTDGWVRGELKHALARRKRKLVIPIVRSGLTGDPLLAQFPRVFTFSPWGHPGEVEGQIVEFLQKRKIDKEKQQAIGALVALGLGMLALFALSEK
jgi:hypothetical protein